MTISVDIDGVLAAFDIAATRVAGKLWPEKKLDLNQFRYGLSKEERKAFWKEIDSTVNFWEKVPPIEENVFALQRFLAENDGHVIYYVTSRGNTLGRTVAMQTERWMVRLGILPWRNYTCVIPVKEPGLKAYVVADLGIQFSIDDLGTTVERCNEVKDHKAYLLDQPYNRDKDYGPRVFNLEQFFNVITRRRPEGYFLA